MTPEQMPSFQQKTSAHDPGFFTLFILVSGVIGLATLTSCASAPASVGEYPNQRKVIGKSKADVLACAGKPVKEQTRNDVVLLQYYKEAPVLEESQPVGKGSMSTIRHGCWATVVLMEDRVTDVRYRFVPPSMDASNDCEAIFDPCAQ